MTRSTINPAVMAEADEAFNYKNHRAPVVIEIPLGSYLRFAAVVILLGVALLNLLPNPVVVS